MVVGGGVMLWWRRFDITEPQSHLGRESSRPVVAPVVVAPPLLAAIKGPAEGGWMSGKRDSQRERNHHHRRWRVASMHRYLARTVTVNVAPRPVVSKAHGGMSLPVAPSTWKRNETQHPWRPRWRRRMARGGGGSGVRAGGGPVANRREIQTAHGAAPQFTRKKWGKGPKLSRVDK